MDTVHQIRTSRTLSLLEDYVQRATCVVQGFKAFGFEGHVTDDILSGSKPEGIGMDSWLEMVDTAMIKLDRNYDGDDMSTPEPDYDGDDMSGDDMSTPRLRRRKVTKPKPEPDYHVGRPPLNGKAFCYDEMVKYLKRNGRNILRITAIRKFNLSIPEADNLAEEYSFSYKEPAADRSKISEKAKLDPSTHVFLMVDNRPTMNDSILSYSGRPDGSWI